RMQGQQRPGHTGARLMQGNGLHQKRLALHRDLARRHPLRRRQQFTGQPRIAGQSGQRSPAQVGLGGATHRHRRGIGQHHHAITVHRQHRIALRSQQGLQIEPAPS
ncbi:hypothetical protein RZS08_35125, partial [Arthrospira platensis SPKY1]|nr:hypothetical protein [Arthrospira platensis SPKY1]